MPEFLNFLINTREFCRYPESEVGVIAASIFAPATKSGLFAFGSAPVMPVGVLMSIKTFFAKFV